MENDLVFAWIFVVVVRLGWALVVPALVVLGSALLWRRLPRWILALLVVSSFGGVLEGVPSMLLQARLIGVQQLQAIIWPFAVAAGAARLLFAIGFLCAAVAVRKRLAAPG